MSWLFKKTENPKWSHPAGATHSLIRRVNAFVAASSAFEPTSCHLFEVGIQFGEKLGAGFDSPGMEELSIA
jgi:hypothetical protein